MPLRKLIALLLVLFPGTGLAAVPESSPGGKLLRVQEDPAWAASSRQSEFSAVAHSNRSSCQAVRPPEALATPSPLLDAASSKIEVSFIVGTDGRVHTPFILESAGSSEDQVVLNAVRSWRYRPATCNGAPTEAEGKIGFSGR